MYASDSRAAEDHGIALNTSDETSDTRYPMNVDDSDLSPDIVEIPMEKAKWTAMSFSLLMIKTSHVLKQLYRTPTASLSTAPSEPSRDRILNELKKHIDTTYLKFCDPNIPIQKATLLCSRLMVGKVEFLLPQQCLNRCDSEKHISHATEETLIEACRILEMNLQLQSEDLLRGFRWFYETFTQYHLLTYVLWYLSVKPTGPNVERAWGAVERSFEIAERRDTSYDPGSRWTVLQLLKDKAVRIRQSRCTDDIMTNLDLEDPSGMKILTSEFGDGADLTFGDVGNWSISATEYPDWSELVGKFDVQSFGGTNYSM
jgi:hypothetical protein